MPYTYADELRDKQQAFWYAAGAIDAGYYAVPFDTSDASNFAVLYASAQRLVSVPPTLKWAWRGFVAEREAGAIAMSVALFCDAAMRATRQTAE